MAVILETSLGDITVDLYTDERPRCSLNFLKLCKIKYYNWCLFHSVQRNLVAQTGDPTGTGRGGDSIFTKIYGEQARYFEMEIKPRIKHKKKGTLSMVNNGDNMHGAQFFLTTGVDLDYLDGVHTVFGEVSEGIDILDKINEAIVDEQNRPFRDIRIFHTVVLDDPFDDPPELTAHIPDRSPEITKDQLESDRLGVDEVVDETQGKSKEEVEEIIKGKAAKANAQLLEMLGDLPEEDARPPDNVLFVCKLNPVTTAEDLEVIFSRFGNILSCEVIKDQKTEESLQYAFIEFEEPRECENAYFKMDNVLIDDRRIHVDFSQSVAKYKWNKGGQSKKDNDEDRPQFVIKDRNKRTDNYEFVFEEHIPKDSSGKKHKKKKRKHKKERYSSDSNSESEQSPPRKERKHKETSRYENPSYKSKHKEDYREKEKTVRYGHDYHKNRSQSRTPPPKDRAGERDHRRYEDRSRSRSRTPPPKERVRERDHRRYEDRSRSRSRTPPPKDRARERDHRRYEDKSRERQRDSRRDREYQYRDQDRRK